jgi:GST-like protein
MTNSSEYTLSKVWTWNYPNSGRFATINRPIAGPTHDKELPVGRHPLQLYSLGTPNGVKITILLEELLAIGQSGADNAPRALKFYVFGQGHGGGEDTIRNNRQ